ncbi:MAG: branched-chain amino acid ABC transporter substrate-binding protein [Rubrivivax sp.]|nr:branched-chain amino acid ABC transporter substrate-binding protein [Rubrivivax sp.]
MLRARRALTLIIMAIALAASLLSPARAQKGETVRLAWIDGLSGMTAATGRNQLQAFQFLGERFSANGKAGVKYQILPFDNKLSPQETVALLQSAIDQGIRYVVQGTGSGPASAIIDFLNKYNERNPGKEVVYLNYAAVDPDLTNNKCSFWHFRLDADTSMRMEALTSFMKTQADIRKVYLINQNYAHGHQVVRYARENLARKRPDIQIVGDDLTPLAQTRDFAPYVAKIKASGADAVLTGNWSADLTLLVKAANEAGLKARFYTYYASALGTPTAMGAAGEGRVFQVGAFPYGAGGEVRKLMDEFRARFKEDFSTVQVFHAYALLDAAFVKARSTDPRKVADALSGLETRSLNGEVQMRRSDHQLQQTLMITSWQRKGRAPNDYDVEGTGYTFVPVQVLPPYVASTPTSCQMKRPG